jgi:serine/threonine-protein kinase
MSESGSPVRIGQRIGDRYEVLEHLGDGRSGEVYRVLDHHLDKVMALKLLKPKPGQPSTWDEAQMLTQLESQYLLPVFNADVAVPSDLRYITTRYMSGGDLESAAHSVGVDSVSGVRLACQIAHGLDRIHDAGLLHRDVKPGNVFLNESGEALLGDLGIAAKVEEDGTASPDGTLVTAAPEVLGPNGRCSIRTDVYSLAATTFYLLSGEYPVSHRGDGQDVFDRVVRHDLRKLRDLAPHVSQAIGTVVERTLSADPADRAETALGFANQLAHARSYRRVWRKLAEHAEHTICLKGDATRSKKAVVVCGIQSGSRWRVEIRRGARRDRAMEEAGLTHAQLLVRLRDLAGRL